VLGGGMGNEEVVERKGRNVKVDVGIFGSFKLSGDLPVIFLTQSNMTHFV